MGQRVALAATLVLLLGTTACGTIPQPVPSTTSSPDGVAATDEPAEETHGWLLEVSETYMTATAELCADDPIVTDPTSQDAAIYAEYVGEPNPEHSAGILMAFYNGTYDMDLLVGTTRDGTYYELRGTFSSELNSDGVPVSGEGAGKGRILYPSGDVDNAATDALTFTLTPIPEPDYCAVLYDAEGNVIE